MAKPRVFVSSTYYDLRHIRSSLDVFIRSLGFEPVLSEMGDIPFEANSPLDESCYREAGNCDIFVLIVGGRYGSEVSGKEKRRSHSFFERYDSITKKEYESALARDIPVYVLIETNVYAELQTYLRNRDNSGVTYAHVDSVNVFRLIEEILGKPRNNPMHTFERFSDIESWLREQWAGSFRELLQRRSQQQQIAALGAQVGDLKEINETLRKYLEALMTGIKPDDSRSLIETERRRLGELERNEQMRRNPWYDWTTRVGIGWEEFIVVVREADSFSDFLNRLSRVEISKERIAMVAEALRDMETRRRLNEVRVLLGLKPLLIREGETLMGEPFDKDVHRGGRRKQG